MINKYLKLHKIYKTYYFPYIVFILLFWLIESCNHDYIPKPKGYFRIDLPKNEYKVFDTLFPYTFEYSKFSVIKYDKDPYAEPYWINIEYPFLRAKIHISYKRIINKADRHKPISKKNKDDLIQYIEDSRLFVNKHIPKANDIEEKLITNYDNKVFGIVYDIEGIGAASTLQYWLTDSTANFLRGALYFEVKPNNDSLAPVIDYIKKDIYHIINTTKWVKKH
jgi:gliding motility-associated lipoprotein GldD